MTDTADIELRKSEVGGVNRSAGWNLLTFGLSKAATFVASVVLARLLVPEAFGVIVLAIAALTWVDVFNEFGVSAGVIYDDREDQERTANVAFGLSMVTGALATTLVFLTAPLLADFFRSPALTDVLRVLSVSFLITSLGSVHEARLRKALRFRSRLLPELSRALTKTAVSIGLALAGYGVWSLVWGQLASAAIATALYWRAARWVPRLQFDSEIARSLLRYGSGFLGVSLLGVMSNQIDYAIIGRRLSDQELGWYGYGYRLPELVVLGVVYAFSQSAFADFSALRSDPARLNRTIADSIGALTLITVPLGFGLAVAAPELVRVLFGLRWEPTATVLPWIAGATVVTSLSFVLGDAYKATGRLGLLNAIALFRLPLAIVLLLIGVQSGIRGVAIAQLAVSGIVLVLQVVVAARVLRLAPILLIQRVAPALGAGGFMVAALLVVRNVVSESAPLTRLGILMSVGVAAYGLAVVALIRLHTVPFVGNWRRPFAPTEVMV